MSYKKSYLKVMRIPLKRGRFGTAQDNEHRCNVIVIDDYSHGNFWDQDRLENA